MRNINRWPLNASVIYIKSCWRPWGKSCQRQRSGRHFINTWYWTWLSKTSPLLAEGITEIEHQNLGCQEIQECIEIRETGIWPWLMLWYSFNKYGRSLSLLDTDRINDNGKAQIPPPNSTSARTHTHTYMLLPNALKPKKKFYKHYPFLNLDIRSYPIDLSNHYWVMNSSSPCGTYLDVNFENPFVCTDWKILVDGNYVVCSQTYFHLDYSIHYRNSNAEINEGSGCSSLYQSK